ncbi:hypothetical protein ES703_90616 [subsurface metagenome]
MKRTYASENAQPVSVPSYYMRHVLTNVLPMSMSRCIYRLSARIAWKKRLPRTWSEILFPIYVHVFAHIRAKANAGAPSLMLQSPFAL